MILDNYAQCTCKIILHKYNSKENVSGLVQHLDNKMKIWDGAEQQYVKNMFDEIIYIKLDN